MTILALLSLIGVIGGVGTYNDIQRRREEARAEVQNALERVEDFCSQAVSNCEEAETILEQLMELYSDYLSEVRKTQMQLSEADRERRKLIEERETRDSRFVALIRNIR